MSSAAWVSRMVEVEDPVGFEIAGRWESPAPRGGLAGPGLEPKLLRTTLTPQHVHESHDPSGRGGRAYPAGEGIGIPHTDARFRICGGNGLCYLEARMSDVTLLAARAGLGDNEAANELLRLVYGELRVLAASQMARERPGQTLQPTALVHEAWLRLGGDHQPAWENRAHFFGAAAEAMRRILVERARRRNTARRGGGRTHVPLDEIEIGGAAGDPHLLEVNDALERFAEREPKKAELVRLRYFIGLRLDEAVRVLGISEATGKRWWIYSRAWLYRELNPGI